jgi:hypothetical protein
MNTPDDKKPENEIKAQGPAGKNDPVKDPASGKVDTGGIKPHDNLGVSNR